MKINFIYFLLVVYILIVLFDLKHFIIWSQISDILIENNTHDNMITIHKLIITNHPHTLRIMLIFLFYTLSEYLHCSLGILYSIVLVVFIFIIYRLNVLILQQTIGISKSFYMLFFLIGLSFFMHGRIIFSILGNTMLLYLLFKLYYTENNMKLYNQILLFFIALWFVSVSSGTFMVFLFSILVFYILQVIVQFPYINKKILFIWSLFILLLLFISPLVLIFINKNLNYYHGSIISMLSHGIGKYIIEYFYVIFPLLVVGLLLIPMFILYIKKYRIFILPLSMILSSLCIGLFGISSLVSGLSAYVIFTYMFISKKRYKGLQYV